MCGSDRIKDRGERAETLQPATLAFEVVALEHNRDVGEFVLMMRHRTRYRLAQLRQDCIIGADARPHW